MAEPCVSVIMPAHNNAPYIGLAIESVLNQSHKNWELPIIEGLRVQRLNLQVVLFGPFKREAAEF